VKSDKTARDKLTKREVLERKGTTGEDRATSSDTDRDAGRSGKERRSAGRIGEDSINKAGRGAHK